MFVYTSNLFGKRAVCGGKRGNNKMSKAAIRIEKLTMVFGEDTVLDHVSRSFEEGKPAKATKAALLLSSGSPGVYDGAIGTYKAMTSYIGLQDMGIIIETPGFLPNLSGYSNLSLLASLKRKIGKSKINEAISKVGLDPDSPKPVGKYSLGMRQRLGIAQAIMEDPSVLILDEPFNGLDRGGVREMRNLILGLKEMKKTILLASHNQVDIDELCDTVCEMDAGVMTMVR